MSIPSILSLFQIILLFFFFKYDTPVYYYQCSLTKEMKEALDCIYVSQEDEKKVCNEIMAREHIDPNASLYEKYKWAFWTGLSLAAIQQLSGLIIVQFYAPQVFAKQGDSQAQILSFMVALINFASTFIAVFISGSISIFNTSRMWS